MQAKPALGLLSYILQPKVESLVTPFSLNVGSAINMGQFFLASQGTASRHIEAQISEESLPRPCSSFHRTGRMRKFYPSSQFSLCVEATGQFQKEYYFQMSLLLLSPRSLLYCGSTWRPGPKRHPRFIREYSRAKMAALSAQAILKAQMSWAQLNNWDFKWISGFSLPPQMETSGKVPVP